MSDDTNISAESQKALDTALRSIGLEGKLCAGFIMDEGELLAVYDNFPGTLSTESFRKLLYQVRDVLRKGSGVEVEASPLNSIITKQEEIN